MTKDQIQNELVQKLTQTIVDQEDLHLRAEEFARRTMEDDIGTICPEPGSEDLSENQTYWNLVNQYTMEVAIRAVAGLVPTTR